MDMQMKEFKDIQLILGPQARPPYTDYLTQLPMIISTQKNTQKHYYFKIQKVISMRTQKDLYSNSLQKPPQPSGDSLSQPLSIISTPQVQEKRPSSQHKDIPPKNSQGMYSQQLKMPRNKQSRPTSSSLTEHLSIDISTQQLMTTSTQQIMVREPLLQQRDTNLKESQDFY